MSRVDRELIAEAVRKLEARDGICEPAAFVDEARDKNSPLHSLFDWDEHANSERWLVHRARQIIGSVTITSKDNTTPAFVHVTIVADDGGKRDGYTSTETAMSDDDLRAQVFREVRANLRGWRNRLAAFEQAEEAVKAVEWIDRAIDELSGDGGDGNGETDE